MLALGIALAVAFLVAFRYSATGPTPLSAPATTTTVLATTLPHASTTTATSSTSHSHGITESKDRGNPASAATAARTATRPRTTQTTVTTTPTSSTLASGISAVSEQWAGALTYPDDVATSYSFRTTGGTVTVTTIVADGTRRLASSLQCGGMPAVQAVRVASMTLRAPAGSCVYNLFFVGSAFHPGAHAGYQITARYPAVVATA